MHVKAGLFAAVNVFGHGVGGQRQDAGAGGHGASFSGPYAAHGFVAVHDGHLAIHEHNVEILLAQGLQGREAVVYQVV